tara:strand:+ start:181 stop:525 length:345 start_codon:yes stop_codon:yes gene_type:complete
MKNQIPLDNSYVFNHEEEIGLLKELCTTKCAPPHTLRKRILVDVNKALMHSLKDRLDSFLHYLLIISFISLILFFNAINYSPPQPRYLIHNQDQTGLPQAFSLPRRNAGLKNSH